MNQVVQVFKFERFERLNVPMYPLLCLDAFYSTGLYGSRVPAVVVRFLYCKKLAGPGF
jgi:hypothetical protein